MSVTAPTEKQYAYARKLRDQLEPARAEEIAGAVFGVDVGIRGNTAVRQHAVNRQSYSRYIDALRKATGAPASVGRRSYGRSRSSWSGGRVVSSRCTHEDFPCCGCGQ